jgi:hypothetical protein
VCSNGPFASVGLAGSVRAGQAQTQGSVLAPAQIAAGENALRGRPRQTNAWSSDLAVEFQIPTQHRRIAVAKGRTVSWLVVPVPTWPAGPGRLQEALGERGDDGDGVEEEGVGRG